MNVTVEQVKKAIHQKFIFNEDGPYYVYRLARSKYFEAVEDTVKVTNKTPGFFTPEDWNLVYKKIVLLISEQKIKL